MNFKDPVTTFAYNLISLHHDVMWYVLMILCIVYWSLYKILKDFSWNVFNKQEGFFSLLYKSKLLVNIQIYIFIIAFGFYKYLFQFCYKFLNKAINLVEDFALEEKGPRIVRLFNFFLGKQYYKNLVNINSNKWKIWINSEILNDLVIERFLVSFLFCKTSNALYFYDRKQTNELNLKVLGFKHSIKLEYVFGFFPTVIISLIIVPSMYLLYSNETDIDPNITIKVVGNQWYWSYQSASINFIKKNKEIIYLDYSYDSIIINELDLIKGSKRLLETDTTLVLPYNVVIRFLITSADVLHAWAVPEFGIKVDAIPGRLNQAIAVPKNLGIFYGQCSELCGVSHGFMPIVVNVISLKDYYNFLINK